MHDVEFLSVGILAVIVALYKAMASHPPAPHAS